MIILSARYGDGIVYGCAVNYGNGGGDDIGISAHMTNENGVVVDTYCEPQLDIACWHISCLPEIVPVMIAADLLPPELLEATKLRCCT